MSQVQLTQWIFVGGIAQLCVLIASALVPIQLNWRSALRPLPNLLRQLFWVYGGYVVLSIIALGLIAIFNAEELAGGSWLGRSVCLYIATFWAIRLALQGVLHARPHLTRWWLTAGYHLLTVVFAMLALLFVWGALHPAMS